MQDRVPESSSIHDLLDEQLNLIQKTLSFNRAIAKRATGDRLLALADSARRSASNSRSPQKERRASERKELPADLAQPLLPPQTPPEQGKSLDREVAEYHASPPAISAASFGAGALVQLLDGASQQASLRSRASDIRSRCRGNASRLLGGPLKNPSPPRARSGSVGLLSPILSPASVPLIVNSLDEEPNGSNKKQVADLKDLKKTIHHLLFDQPQGMDVEALYKETGLWQRIARSAVFKNTTFVMILLSTLWLAVDTDYNKAVVLSDAPMVFQVVDNIICTYFLAELVIRWLAFQRLMQALCEATFILDLMLVVMMVLDTWVMVLLHGLGGDSFRGGRSMLLFQAFRSLRLLRITRALRMNRLFRSVPEFMVFVHGMTMAVRSVLTTLLMLVLVTYTFAIIFTQLYSDATGLADKFGTVAVSTNYLLLQVLAGWSADDFNSLLQNGSYVGYSLLLCYLLIGSLTIMNMLVGILVDVVQTCAAAQDDETMLKELKQDIAAIVSITDRDGDNTVTAEEFHTMLRNPDAVQKLYHGGVNVLALADFADFFFRDTDEMNMEEFIESILQFRGNQQASGKDVVDLRVHMSQELARLAQAASLLPK